MRKRGGRKKATKGKRMKEHKGKGNREGNWKKEDSEWLWG
jgi:hypothetical protein